MASPTPSKLALVPSSDGGRGCPPVISVCVATEAPTLHTHPLLSWVFLVAPLLLPDILGSYLWVHGRFSCFLERYLLSSLRCQHWHLQSHFCVCSGTMSALPVPVETGNPTLIQRFKMRVQVYTDPQRPGISGHREISWDTSGGHFHITSGPEIPPPNLALPSWSTPTP